MRRMEEVLNMPLVTVQEGTRLGRITGAELDTAGGWVRYLRFRGEGRGPGGMLPWIAVQNVGTDAVTVTSTSEVIPSLRQEDQDRLASHIGDRPVVTESGTELGRVVDYTFDVETGKVETYLVEAGGFLGRLSGRTYEFPHAAVRAFGKDAIVVADEVVPAERAA